MEKTNWKPEGYHTVTPYLSFDDVGKAIDFYKEAFGAQELSRLPGPGGAGVMHAELKIGDSIFMLGQSCPESSHHEEHKEHHEGHQEGHMACMLHIYCEDVDASFERAQKAGAQVKMPLENMFWGDRYGMITDPFGHVWSLATHIEDLSEEQMRERAEEFFAKTSKR